MTTPESTTSTVVSTDKVASEAYQKELDSVIEKLRRADNGLKSTIDNYLSLAFKVDSVTNERSQVYDDLYKVVNLAGWRLSSVADRLEQIKGGIKTSAERFDK